MKISIKGRRSVTGEPVWIRTEELPAGCCSAVTEDGKRFPAQSKGDGVLVIADLDREKAVEAELSLSLIHIYLGRDRGPGHRGRRRGQG